MLANTPTDIFQIMVDPLEAELRATFPPYIFEKIVRHLDPCTGNILRGEFQCTSIASVIHNQYMVEVFYRTNRPDGTAGHQFIRFYPFTATMRCLPVTSDGQVVMIQEHRRMRGAWVQMLPAGGEKLGRSVDVLVAELLAETGCRLNDDSRVIEIANAYMDDGIFGDRLQLLVADRLHAPRDHNNPFEGIRGIVLVPFVEWHEKSLRGEFDDIYCTIFAARCYYDFSTARVIVHGKQTVLRDVA